MASPRLIVQLTRALLHEPRARRTMMFWTTIATLALAFLGATFLSGFLRGHILLFLLWWGACAWLLMASVLLALFDILMIRSAARRERRNLARQAMGMEGDEDAR